VSHALNEDAIGSVLMRKRAGSIASLTKPPVNPDVAFSTKGTPLLTV
jgi:hypothetical protein